MALTMANGAVGGVTKFCSFCSKLQLQKSIICRPQTVYPFAYFPRRDYGQKHYDPKWRKQRAMKVHKFELPDYEKLRRDAHMSPEEQRSYFKREGIQPPRTHQERDIVLASTGAIFEAYVPPEGDGIASLVSGKGAKQRLTELEKKGKSFLQLRKIRQFEPFETADFADLAFDIYLKAHDLLQDIDKNEDELHDLVSERAYPEMVWKLEKKTVRWKYVEALEPPRTVHIRTVDMMSKENLYAQVTVRFHTKQTLAIYDRFGRLMYGSETLVKDCLEYIVYEKHLSDENGRWRIHGKVIPDWMPARQPVLRTMRMPTIPHVEEDEKSSSDAKGDTAATA